MAALKVSPFHVLLLFSLFLSLLSNYGLKSAVATVPPKKIGNGYRLISVGDAPGGGILGILQVNTKTQIYGPDIPFLQLFVKYIGTLISHFYIIFIFWFILVDSVHLIFTDMKQRTV